MMGKNKTILTRLYLSYWGPKRNGPGHLKSGGWVNSTFLADVFNSTSGFGDWFQPETAGFRKMDVDADAMGCLISSLSSPKKNATSWQFCERDLFEMVK